MPEQSRPQSPPGVHLAFLYSLAMPGLGEYRLGARIRGSLTMALVLGCLAWCCWVLAAVVNSLFSLAAPTYAAYLQLAASLGGMLFLWLWGMFAAVDVAIQRGLRREDEQSAFWAVLMSWICPGAGQLYTGSRLFAFCLFACYLIATIYLFPAYKLMIDIVRSMLAGGSFQHAPVQALSLVRQAQFQLNYGFANLAVQSIEALSMVLAAAALQPVWHAAYQLGRQRRLLRGPDGKAPSERGLPFGQRTEARVLSILALGWLCPGSGQLLLKQELAGWSLFCLYVCGKICIGVLLTLRIISYDTAQSLTWIPALARLAAMGLGLAWVTSRPKPAAAPSRTSRSVR